jgi:two-component system chemotaxis response regulator CheB
MDRVLRVLVVDDSAYVRKVVSAMLSRSPFIEVVGTARNGAEALESVEQLKPDVVTSDLNMPVMDGVAFVREQMRRAPVPVLIISIAAESTEQVLAALDAGAVDFVQKPTALATERLMEIAEEVVQKVKTAARVKPVSPSGDAPAPAARRGSADARKNVEAVVIGISTGGPQALKRLVPALPADFPIPILMVLHMPLGYTAMYAAKLDEMSKLRVIEAREGDPLEAGTAYLAPAGRHLIIRRGRPQLTTGLELKPLDAPHRPSVDVLFQSAAEVFGGSVAGVVMTGMGSDGREGAAWIKSRGGYILAEAEETCVVYGMPRAVVEAGLADRIVPLEAMAGAIVDLV